MEIVPFGRASVLVQVVPRSSKSLYSSLAHLFHGFNLTSGEHRLTTASLKRDCLARSVLNQFPRDEDTLSTATEVLKCQIFVYHEHGQIDIYGKRFSFYKTLRIIQRHRPVTRSQDPSHYDCVMQRFPEYCPVKRTQPPVPLSNQCPKRVSSSAIQSVSILHPFSNPILPCESFHLSPNCYSPLFTGPAIRQRFCSDSINPSAPYPICHLQPTFAH